jgi:hypothetical protein
MTSKDPRAVALDLLGLGGSEYAMEVVQRREACFRREEPKLFWYSVGLEVIRLSRVRGGKE